ncbi:MAG: GGDEF domain-containing protein [Candidatus Omnitrophica bacterium]|nr:GGDEF domain-containing protein [Candidatus Omnitrophota bacterium]
MITTKINKAHNTLLITFIGHVDVQQSKLLFKRLDSELKKVASGFSLVADLSQLEAMDRDVMPDIKEMMTLCNDAGVTRISHIIPDVSKDIGFNILSVFHYSPSVKICTYRSLQEAEYFNILSSDVVLTKKLVAILHIIRTNIAHAMTSNLFRLGIIASGFAGLIIARSIIHVFGASLGYLYMTLIALSAFWFSIPGGIIAALFASVIFIAEVHVYESWQAQDIVHKSMLIRLCIYFLSGFVIGVLAKTEEKLRNKLEFSASHDELTGFYNYRFTVTLFEKEVRRAIRHTRPLCVAIIDIDHFKTINDSYGHLVGNDILKSFSAIIQKNIRSEDCVGRYGGDEFVILFPESSIIQATQVVKRIQDDVVNTKMTSTYLIDKDFLIITFSAGLSALKLPSSTVNDLLNNADHALYQAKEGGRNAIFVH